MNPIVCHRNSKATAQDPFPIDLKVIEEAYHGFDIPKHGARHWADRSEINPDQYSAGGGTLEYDAEHEKRLIELVWNHLDRTMTP